MQEIADILKIYRLGIEDHLHKFDYVNHFNVWVHITYVKKTFLTMFLHAILY